MSFKVLSALLATQPLREAEDASTPSDHVAEHPVLSRAEVVRLNDKLDQARGKLEELRSIFKPVPGATGPAHKLHHIGSKAGFDLSVLNDVTSKIDELEASIDDLHQTWGTQLQSEDGSFDDSVDTDPDTDEDTQTPEQDNQPAAARD